MDRVKPHQVSHEVIDTNQDNDGYGVIDEWRYIEKAEVMSAGIVAMPGAANPVATPSRGVEFPHELTGPSVGVVEKQTLRRAPADTNHASGFVERGHLGAT